MEGSCHLSFPNTYTHFSLTSLLSALVLWAMGRNLGSDAAHLSWKQRDLNCWLQLVVSAHQP